MSVQDIEEPRGLNLAERIRRLANGRTTLDVAQFQFIGLNDIRRRYGERWPEKRERVQAVASHFIARRLATQDVLIPGADGFLVVFGSTFGSLADVAASRISKDLNDFFIGADPEDADIRFETRRAEMSVDDLAHAFGALIETHEQQVAVAPAEHAPHDLSHVRFQALPVWDSSREALTTYLIQPIDSRTGEALAGGAFEPGASPPRSHTELDELQLKVSEDAIRRLFASGRKAFVGVTLHISSVNSSSSIARLFSVMSRFDRELLRYRVIRIGGIEPGFPRIYLDDIARTMRARIPRLAFGLHWSEPDIPSLIRMAPASVGFALSHAVLGPHGPRTELFSRIHHAVELGKAHDVPVFVDGDLTPEHAARIAGEGVQLLSSPQIWPARAELDGAQRWPATQLPHARPRDTAA